MSVDAQSIDYDFVNTVMSASVLGYRLDYVKKLMIPLEFMHSWAVYVVDPDHRHMYIMDPTLTSEGSDAMRARHEANARRILYELVRCIHENILDWEISVAGWQFRYNGGTHASCTREQSGVYVLHYIRNYNGVWLEHVLTNERPEYLRSSMAYQIMYLARNAGDLLDFMVQIII